MATGSNEDFEKGSAPDVEAAGLTRDVGEGTVSDKHMGKRGAGMTYVDDLSEVEASRGLFGSLIRRLRFMRVEERGIERVKEEDRAKQSPLDGFTMWASANFTPATLATGALGPIFGLGFWDSFSVILIVNFVFSWVVAWFGCLGPETGLRTMSIGRYSFGIWGARILVVLNLCGMIGWSAVNGIAGAQVLTEVSDGRCPLWAGNLIIGVCTAFVSFLGYFAVHWFERICWLPQLFAFVFLAGYGAKHFDASASPMGSGSAEAAGVMSFFAVVYGFIIGWAGCAADYNVRMPRDTSRTRLAVSVWGGNFCGAVATELLGAAFMTAVAADPAFAAAYDDRGIGGVLGQALAPIGGFGKFLLVLLALSIVGCNLVNIYSLAFMCQNFHPVMVRVPRFVWTLLGSAAYIAVAIAGEDSFAAVLESFLSVIGYYTTPFLACVAVEHFLFRKGTYPLEDWNNMDVLPYGIAGIAALVMAFVGAVLAMDQEWYEGVVSRAVKPDGAELGWIFSLVFSVAAFIPVRYLEKRYTGR